MTVELAANTIGSSAASTTLNGAITNVATSATLTSATGFSVTGGQMRAVLDPGTVNAEIVIITALAGTTATLTRGQEGTTAVAHLSGVPIVAEITAASFNNTIQSGTAAGGDLGSTYPNPTVTSGAHLGAATVPLSALAAESDGKYMRGTSGLWVAANLAYADLTGVPASFTPSAHASTHDPSGTDPIHDLSRLAGGPASLGLLAWSFDLAAGSGNGFALTAGTIYLAKLLTAHVMTINEIDLYIQVAGTGTTSLANCFVGIYDSSGTQQFVSANQSSSWATSTLKRITVTGGYTVTANDYIYIAFLIGTQSSTACQITKANNSGAAGATNNQGANVAAAYRMATNGTGKTSLPASLTLSSNTGSGVLFWTGVA